MARIKEITLSKELKVGLPNYSNLTLHCGITFELGKEEKPNWELMWDEVNKQLYTQSAGIEPSWLEQKEYRNFFKVTYKIPKGGDE